MKNWALAVEVAVARMAISHVVVAARAAEAVVVVAKRSDRSPVVVKVAISSVAAEVVEVAEKHRSRPLLLLHRSQRRSQIRPRSRNRCNFQWTREIKTPRPEIPDAASSRS